MAQRTVLKVHIACQKCKMELLKAVSALQGINNIEVDEAKGTLTVIGSADPYDIITRVRRTGKLADVVSVGPPPAPPKQEAQKKPEAKKPEEKKPDHNPPCYICAPCERMAVVHVDYYPEPSYGCSIL